MTSVLVDLISTRITDSRNKITGKILTRPRLLYGDSVSLTYAADVDIGRTGRDPITGEYVVRPLRNVPIAAANHDLIYADVGQAVTLERSSAGRYEIVGLSKRGPGTYNRIPVCLARGDACPPVDVGLSSRLLTLGELKDYMGGFGYCPFGAIAVFQGDTLLEIRV